MNSEPMSLRQHRARRILTIQELAKTAKVGRQTIVRIERGETNIRPSVFRRLAGTLEVKPEEIREFLQVVMRDTKSE